MWLFDDYLEKFRKDSKLDEMVLVGFIRFGRLDDKKDKNGEGIKVISIKDNIDDSCRVFLINVIVFV